MVKLISPVLCFGLRSLQTRLEVFDLITQLFQRLLALLQRLETFVSKVDHFDLRGSRVGLGASGRGRRCRTLPDFLAIGLARLTRGCPSTTYQTRKQHAERPSPVHILIISELLEECVTISRAGRYSLSTRTSRASGRSTPGTCPGRTDTAGKLDIYANAYLEPRRPRTIHYPTGAVR